MHTIKVVEGELSSGLNTECTRHDEKPYKSGIRSPIHHRRNAESHRGMLSPDSCSHELVLSSGEQNNFARLKPLALRCPSGEVGPLSFLRTQSARLRLRGARGEAEGHAQIPDACNASEIRKAIADSCRRTQIEKKACVLLDHWPVPVIGTGIKMRKLVLTVALAGMLLGCAAQTQATVAQQPPLQGQPMTPPAAPTPPIAAPGATRVIMLRVYVADLDRAFNFYQNVFHATVAPGMTSFRSANRGSAPQANTGVRFLNFPGGTLPMLVLIESEQSERMNGSWVLQVPNLEATLEAARANGAQLMDTDYNAPQAGMAARSSHIVDPDGNLIEVLQLGAPG